MKKKTKLTPQIIQDKGFNLIEKRIFENIDIPYYVNNSLCLFFNEPYKHGDSFLVGIGDQKMDKYYAVTFRWIDTVEQLDQIIEAYNILKGDSRN